MEVITATFTSPSAAKADIRTLVIGSVYSNLDFSRKETRLIVVASGTGNQTLECSFQNIFLNDHSIPPYETVSYVWGDTSKRGSLMVDGSALDVPLSVERVLKRVRLQDEPRTIWIDAVCIDQQETTERNYQVKMMDDIYSKGTRGIIWLGEEDHAEEIFKNVADLHEEAQEATRNFETLKETCWPGWWDVYGSPTSVSFRPEILVKLYDCAWFKRLWVVQEAALPSSSICYYGNSSISLLDLLRATVWLYNKGKTLPPPLSGHTGIARGVHTASYTDPLFLHPFQAGANLLWMLNTLRQYDTTENKDHIYGLIGMYRRFVGANNPLPSRLIPDYARSLYDIFADAAKLTIEELPRMDVLIYVAHRSSGELDNSDLPTWVPPWHRKQDLMFDALPLNFADIDTSQGHWPQTAPSRSVKTLEVSGHTIGRVHNATSVFDFDSVKVPNRLLALFREVEEICEGSAVDQTNVERALVASHNHKRQLMSQEECSKGYASLVRTMVKEDRLPTLTDRGENLNGAYYVEALSRWTRNRRAFTTDTGQCGIGPKIVQRGDIVVLLRGSAWPMVLRKWTGRATYAVVGQAYLEGVMLGEAMGKGLLSESDEQYIIE